MRLGVSWHTSCYLRREGDKGVDLVFYSPVSGSPEERLQRVIESVIPAWGGAVCRTIDDLSERLLQPKNDLTIAFLLAAKKEDVVGLLPMSNLFRNTRIILIVPDWDKETIAAAHLLRPRLLTYSDSDFAEVFTVLTKMMGDYHSPHGM
jgi:hypothetical protein